MPSHDCRPEMLLKALKSSDVLNRWIPLTLITLVEQKDAGEATLTLIEAVGLTASRFEVLSTLL